MKLPSECPSCGYDGYREVGTTLYQQEFTHTDEGEIIDWGDREDFPEGDEATHYECVSCGSVVYDLQQDKTPEQIITEAIAALNLHTERLKFQLSIDPGNSYAETCLRAAINGIDQAELDLCAVREEIRIDKEEA